MTSGHMKVSHNKYLQCSVYVLFIECLSGLLCFIDLKKKLGTIDPELQAVLPGTTVNITCTSHSVPKWFIIGGEIKSGVFSSYYPIHTLTLFNVTLKHTNRYGCLGTVVSGDSFRVISRLIVGCKFYSRS